MSRVVLVHGAWGSPAHWDLVVEPLRARGCDVTAVCLHRGSLAADTAAVQGVVDTTTGEDRVVCAWSYGGAVITGLELSPRDHLVYLAALMPDENETVNGLVETRPADLEHAILWADAPVEAAMKARTALRAQALQCVFENPARVAWRTTPSTYVVCSNDRVVHPDLQRRLAQRATTVVEWPSSHAPMLSMPDRVVELLADLARP